MQLVIDLPDYDPAKGLQYNWEHGFCIKVLMDNEGVTIQGNQEGLRSLAYHILSLANEEVPRTSHIHLDSDSGLEEGSTALIISKELERP